jgi:hypothetical protein
VRQPQYRRLAALRVRIDTNYGGAWHTISAPNLPNRFVAGLMVDPANAAHIYAVYNGYSRRWIPDGGTGHVFESTDGGATWTDISVLLPDVPSDALVLSGGKLLLGTDIGAFIANAGGGVSTAWSRLGTNLPKTSLNDVRLDPNGTTGARGVPRSWPLGDPHPVSTESGRGGWLRPSSANPRTTAYPMSGCSRRWPLGPVGAGRAPACRLCAQDATQRETREACPTVCRRPALRVPCAQG